MLNAQPMPERVPTMELLRCHVFTPLPCMRLAASATITRSLRPLPPRLGLVRALPRRNQAAMQVVCAEPVKTVVLIANDTRTGL